jgi:hypothetical protein
VEWASNTTYEVKCLRIECQFYVSESHGKWSKQWKFVVGHTCSHHEFRGGATCNQWRPGTPMFF